MDEKQLKNINSRSNLKKFLDHVTSNNVEKVNKMCNKGLDPNFHCHDSGGKALPPIFHPWVNINPKSLKKNRYFEQKR